MHSNFKLTLLTVLVTLMNCDKNCLLHIMSDENQTQYRSLNF